MPPETWEGRSKAPTLRVSTDGRLPAPFAGMNAAVRAVTRMGIYVGAKVFLIYEVRCGQGGRRPTLWQGAVRGEG